MILSLPLSLPPSPAPLSEIAPDARRFLASPCDVAAKRNSASDADFLPARESYSLTP